MSMSTRSCRARSLRWSHKCKIEHVFSTSYAPMLVPVRCNCGLPLGDIAPIFNRIRHLRVVEALKGRDITPKQAMIDASLEIDMVDVFEDLGIWDDHCRRALTTAMEFQTYY